MDVQVSRSTFDVVIDHDVFVKMRDEVKLATDIYRPAKKGMPLEGRFPTILQRTPYNKEEYSRKKGLGEWFTSRGYIVVIQDFRGRFKSDGTFYKYANMGEDGYDTIEWIANQPWFNGNVGTIGTSFMAHFQIALACMNPPHLKTMIINQGGFNNAYFSSCRHMGAFELRQLTWTFHAAANSREALDDIEIKTMFENVNPSDYLDPSIGPLPKGETPLSIIPSYERFYLDMLTKANYTKYWTKIGLCAEKYLDKIPDIPILLIGSWYDSYTRNTSDLYQGLSKGKNGPIKLIFGPWTHGWKSLEKPYSGDVDFGSNASFKGTGFAITPNDFALKWFDRWLKNIHNDVNGIPPVTYFIMGGGDGRKNANNRMNHGGVWKTNKNWPLKEITYKKFYLNYEGKLTLIPPDADAQPSSFSFDPLNPVPTIGGNISSAHGVMMPGAFDQIERPDVLGCRPPYLPLSSREDVLVFETRPLEEPVEITGPITARLYISTSARDTDFTLKIIDCHPSNEDYPHGFAMNLSDTIFRARFHNSWEKPELLRPEKVYKLEMISYPTSNLFERDHRIRIDISSSNYPRFDINPNSGEPLGLGKNFTVAHQKVYHEAQYPSQVVFPIIMR